VDVNLSLLFISFYQNDGHDHLFLAENERLFFFMKINVSTEASTTNIQVNINSC
jgi:hypothetical protein